MKEQKKYSKYDFQQAKLVQKTLYQKTPRASARNQTAAQPGEQRPPPAKVQPHFTWEAARSRESSWESKSLGLLPWTTWGNYSRMWLNKNNNSKASQGAAPQSGWKARAKDQKDPDTAGLELQPSSIPTEKKDISIQGWAK